MRHYNHVKVSLCILFCLLFSSRLLLSMSLSFSPTVTKLTRNRANIARSVLAKTQSTRSRSEGKEKGSFNRHNPIIVNRIPAANKDTPNSVTGWKHGVPNGSSEGALEQTSRENGKDAITNIEKESPNKNMVRVTMLGVNQSL